MEGLLTRRPAWWPAWSSLCVSPPALWALGVVRSVWILCLFGQRMCLIGCLSLKKYTFLFLFYKMAHCYDLMGSQTNITTCLYFKSNDIVESSFFSGFPIHCSQCLGQFWAVLVSCWWPCAGSEKGHAGGVSDAVCSPCLSQAASLAQVWSLVWVCSSASFQFFFLSPL